MATKKYVVSNFLNTDWNHNIFECIAIAEHMIFKCSQIPLMPRKT